MASVLTIAGSTVNRFNTHIILNRLTHRLDGFDELEFTELNASLPGSYHPEQAVTLTVDGTLEFAGWIFSRHIGNIGQQCPAVGYRCLDLRFGASLTPITASDGTGTMRFNLPTTDDNYQSTQAGKSVGDILTEIFNLHSTVLGAMGISTDATTATQFAALIAVPPPAVYISGNDLWGQCLQLLQQWYASKYALWITPGGLVRCNDTTTLTGATLTLDSDPVILDSLSEDTSECFTQVVLRGNANVQPYYASLREGTLIDPNATGSPAPEASWTIYDFLFPPKAFDRGAVSAQTSTTVTVSSDFATLAVGANYWSGIQAQIAVINPAITGLATLTGAEWKTITANTAMSAGGSCTITVDSAFENTGYTRYAIRGSPPGISECYRQYTFKNRYVAQHLTSKFPHSVIWSPSEPTITATNAIQSTLFPQSVIVSTPSLSSSVVEWPLNFQIVPYDGTTDGYIRFYEPTVDVVGGNGGQLGQPLITGGSSVVQPYDIIVLVPYSRGALSATEPLTGGPTPTPTYSGTAYTRFNVQRALYRDYPDWLDFKNTPAMQTLASQILDTVSNVVQEGSITYLGKYSTALIGGSWPFALNIAKATGTTGYESMAAPVRSMSLEWPQEGATPWVTRLQFSTKRQQYSGDRLYLHPMYNYQGGIFGQMQGILAVGAPLAGFAAEGIPGTMGGYGGETGTTPLPSGAAFTGAAGGPLGFSPVNGPGGANLPGYGTARTGLTPDLSQAGDMVTAGTSNTAIQQALANQASQRAGLFEDVGAASQARLAPGFQGYEVAGTIAPDVGNPFAQSMQTFAGLNASLGINPNMSSRMPAPIAMPRAQAPEFERAAPRQPERPAQGMRGVTTTQAEREQAAQRRAQREAADRADIDATETGG